MTSIAPQLIMSEEMFYIQLQLSKRDSSINFPGVLIAQQDLFINIQIESQNGYC